MLDGTVEGQLNVQLFYKTLARILGEEYGVKLTATVRRKDEPPGPEKVEEEPSIAV